MSDLYAATWNGRDLISTRCAVVLIGFMWQFCFTTSNLLADDSKLLHSALKQYFYQPSELDELLAFTSVTQTLDYLKTTKLDRWSKLHSRQGLSTLVPAAEQDNFGLQLLEQDGKFFLLPGIDSPNEVDEFRLYAVEAAPNDGDWPAAMNAGTLRLLPPYRTHKFFTGEYRRRALRVEAGVVRVDDFVNRTLGDNLSRYEQQISVARTVDLRFNGGGRLDYAALLLEYLIGSEHNFGYAKKRDVITPYGANKEVSVAKASGLIVLVSRHTASAAEWVARNLQIYGATIVGERTAGKCLIHGIYPIGQKTYIEFAIGEVFAPSIDQYSHCSHGLVPNVLLDVEALLSTDSHVLAATLRACVSNPLDDRAQRECKPLLYDFSSHGDTGEPHGGENKREPTLVEHTIADNTAVATAAPDSVGAAVAELPGRLCLDIQSQWQLHIDELSAQQAADMLSSITDLVAKLHADAAVTLYQGKITISPIVGRDTALQILREIENEFQIAIRLVMSDRRAAYQRQLETLLKHEDIRLANTADARLCFETQYSREQATSLIRQLEELAGFTATFESSTVTQAVDEK